MGFFLSQLLVVLIGVNIFFLRPQGGDFETTASIYQYEVAETNQFCQVVLEKRDQILQVHTGTDTLFFESESSTAAQVAEFSCSELRFAVLNLLHPCLMTTVSSQAPPSFFV